MPTVEEDCVLVGVHTDDALFERLVREEIKVDGPWKQVWVPVTGIVVLCGDVEDGDDGVEFWRRSLEGCDGVEDVVAEAVVEKGDACPGGPHHAAKEDGLLDEEDPAEPCAKQLERGQHPDACSKGDREGSHDDLTVCRGAELDVLVRV